MKKSHILASAMLGFVVVAMMIVIGTAHAQVATTGVPTVPNSVSATVNRSNQVYVSWSPSSETSTAIAGYYLYRDGSLIASTPGFTFYTDTPKAGVYSYAVSSYDVNGHTSIESTSTPTVSVLADTMAPTTPTGVVASISSSSVALSWTASTDNFGVVGYYIYRNGLQIITKAPITGTTYLDSGLSEGATYTYSVAAYDAAGNISSQTVPVSATTIFDVLAPTAPQRLSAIPVSSSEIDLSWQPATDNIDVAGYYIYRNGKEIATTASTTYNDAGLAAGTTYGYTVYAYDEINNISTQSPGATATTLPTDTTPPSTPASFSAVPLSSSQVQLNWSASTDNVGVTGYLIWRNGTQIVVTTSTSYTDNNLSTSVTYEYVIKARDAAGNVSSQASLAIKTLATSIAPVVSSTTTTNSPPAVATTTNSPAVITTSPTTTTTNSFTTALYYGLRSSGVQTLQVFLTQQGYLPSLYDTGFYGNLTVGAVQKFQCAQNIICSGSAFTTGWGLVGPRTRSALNAF